MARVVIGRLAEEYPGTAEDLCALDHDSAFQLLVATILSAQSTDVRVNMVTPAVFAAYPEPSALARASPDELEELIHSTGFFRAKARSLIGMAAAVEERFDGEVPTALEDLVTLPGVGRKTANVVRSVAFGLPGLPVDTHVLRLSKRLGLTKLTDPVKVELELNAIVPAAERGAFSLRTGGPCAWPGNRRVSVVSWPISAQLRPSKGLVGPRPGKKWRPDLAPDDTLWQPGVKLKIWNRYPPPGSDVGRQWDPPPDGPARCRPFGAGIG
jgi:endonuclease-3